MYLLLLSKPLAVTLDSTCFKTASSSNFASNSISWAEASIGVLNHQVRYILKDHPANLMNQGALVIVKASGKAPTHPRLVCIHNDEWTEVR